LKRPEEFLNLKRIKIFRPEKNQKKIFHKKLGKREFLARKP
jgi:hypothetical protein